MFRFIKRLLIFAIILFLALMVLVIFFPRSYESQSTLIIQAPQTKVFENAKDLSRWHLIAMIGGLSKMNMGADIQKQIGSQLESQIPKLPAVNVDSLMSTFSGAKDLLNMKIALTKADPPNLIVYKIEGGLMNGVQTEMQITAADEKNSQVVIKESGTFEGFFGSVKAQVAKYGGDKLNQTNLDNLKKLCER